MKLCYVCEYCEEVISELETDGLDTEEMGIANLTEDERNDIMEMDESEGKLCVTSLCDDCISSLGLDYDLTFAGEPPLH